MKRRDFIKFVGAGALVFPINPIVSTALATPVRKWNSYRLTYQVTLPSIEKNVRLWLPLPNTNDTEYQFTQGSLWNGNATKAEFSTIGNSSFPVFTAEWHEIGEKSVTVNSIVKTSDYFVDLRDHQASNKTTIPADIRPFLNPSKSIPTNGQVQETAFAIIKLTNAQTPLAQAQAIYNWVIDNVRYDNTLATNTNSTIEHLLSGNLTSNNTTDINSIFVGLARAAGIPVRHQNGIRVAESKHHNGIGELGDISHAHHSRAEFYLSGFGWVPVDPAFVCKAIRKDTLAIDHPAISNLREHFFGSWEMNWVTFNHSEDIDLGSNSIAGKLPIFMYPHAEVGNQVLENPADFSYTIVSSELIGTGANL